MATLVAMGSLLTPNDLMHRSSAFAFAFVFGQILDLSMEGDPTSFVVPRRLWISWALIGTVGSMPSRVQRCGLRSPARFSSARSIYQPTPCAGSTWPVRCVSRRMERRGSPGRWPSCCPSPSLAVGCSTRLVRRGAFPRPPAGRARQWVWKRSCPCPPPGSGRGRLAARWR